MGVRTISNWVLSSGSEYRVRIIERKSRVRVVSENAVDLSLGSAIGSLSAGEYFYDYDNEYLYVRASDSGDPNIKTYLLYEFYTVFGAWGTEAEMTNLEMFQTFTNSKNLFLRYIKIWIMRKNAAIYSNLRLDIHSELSGLPTKNVLISPENSYSNTDVSTEDNLASEIYFKYNYEPLKESEKYCLVLKASGTFTKSAHVAWLKMQPVYSSGLTLDSTLLTVGPYRYALIGRDALI